MIPPPPLLDAQPVALSEVRMVSYNGIIVGTYNKACVRMTRAQALIEDGVAVQLGLSTPSLPSYFPSSPLSRLSCHLSWH